jgi:pyrimidine operon attenuation protein/uracil phosphoribosyltransferase
LLDAEGVEAAIEGIARGVLDRGDDLGELAVIGIRRRGVPLAERLAQRIGARAGGQVATGALDITLYRDDLSLVADQPVVHGTEIDFPVDGLRVVLVDDVLFTGRTIRAAIDALFGLGRPARVELAVLVDRGHRELPFEANYVGLRVETTLEQNVEVHVAEIDGQDLVELAAKPGVEA